MPERCVVPGCNKTQGHRFPDKSKEPERRAAWIQAIKRLEKVVVEKDSKERIKFVKWEPKTGREIVCREHFKPTDYRTTQPGTIGNCFVLL